MNYQTKKEKRIGKNLVVRKETLRTLAAKELKKVGAAIEYTRDTTSDWSICWQEDQ